jgi:siroheme synthase
VVKVTGGRAEFEESRRGRKLLRLTTTAEVDGVRHEYEVIYGNGRNNTAVARANAPGGKETDAERLAAVVKALTGREPKVYRMKNGKIKCYKRTFGRLHALRRAGGRHREVAGGDEPVNAPRSPSKVALNFFKA